MSQTRPKKKYPQLKVDIRLDEGSSKPQQQQHQSKAKIRDGRRFSKALSKSGLLELSPLPALESPPNIPLGQTRTTPIATIREEAEEENLGLGNKIHLNRQETDPALTFLNARAKV